MNAQTTQHQLVASNFQGLVCLVEETLKGMEKDKKKLEKEKLTFSGYCMIGVISSKGKNWDDIIF